MTAATKELKAAISTAVDQNTPPTVSKQEALDQLSDREQTIIRERHLVYEPVTLEELGKQLGVSKERVRQLEQRAMDKLKVSMSRHVNDAQDILMEL